MSATDTVRYEHNIYLRGGFRYAQGSEGVNKYLKSDAQGNAIWSLLNGNISVFTNDSGYITLADIPPSTQATWGNIIGDIQDQLDLIGLPISTFTNDSGYLTSENDPIFSAWLATPPNISIFNNNVGYLITETDPVFSASDAFSITSTDISNWNAKLDNITGWNTGIDTELTATVDVFTNSLTGLTFGNTSPFGFFSITVTSDLTLSSVGGNIVIPTIPIDDASTNYLWLDGSKLRVTSIPPTSAIPTLNQVTTAGNSTTNDITVGVANVDYLMSTSNIRSTAGVFEFRELAGGAYTTLGYNGAGDIVFGGMGYDAWTWTKYGTSFKGSNIDLTNGLVHWELLGNGITNNRILTIPDASGVIPISVNGQIANSAGAITLSIPSVTPSALTRTNDTNITVTLGGSPNTALLQGVSLTMGWAGTLADARIASASNWNTAFGWGNHATAGYLLSSTAATTYQLLDGDLTSIAALGFTSTAFLKKTAANTWALDTNTYFNTSSAAALTKTDDTNVTLTLGGSPTSALLAATSLTLGWTGTLADARITSSANWNTAYTNRITSLTNTGSSGAATLISNTLNIPNYTLSGLGGQPLDSDLTAIAALTGTSGFLKTNGSGTWSVDTATYLTTTSASSTYQPLDSDLTAIAALTTDSFGRGLLPLTTAVAVRSYIGAGTGSGDALVANPLSQFAATTSTQLAGIISDETGSGALVFGTGPTLTSPVLTGVGSPTYTQGKLVYDTTNESLTFYNNDSNVSLQIGQEEWIRVKNVSGSTIANGAAVYINGSNSGLPTIALAQSNSGSTTVGAGLATESIANNAIGYVTCIGLVNGMDTSAFAAGVPVYISSSVAGGLTATAPLAPNYRYRIGIVGTSSATVGTIHVTPSTAALGNGTANQLVGVNNAGTAQEVKTIQGTTGQVTVTHTANTITLSTGNGSVHLLSDFTTASTSSVATNLKFTAEANTSYKVTVVGTVSKATTTTGMKVAIDAPSGTTIKGIEQRGQAIASTALQGSLITALNTQGGVMATGAGVEVPFRLEFTLRVGVTGGDVTLLGATMTSNTATIYADTSMAWVKSTGV